jgi:hypothetical protein
MGVNDLDFICTTGMDELRYKLRYFARRTAGSVAVTAPREGGDVTGSKVKRRSKRMFISEGISIQQL